MSYNIDLFETVKCELTIALDDLLEFSEQRDYITVKQKKGGMIKASGISEGFELEGTKGANDVITVEKINTWGEGSGHGMDVFKELLELTRGKLKAVLYWEGGNEVEKFVCIDGKVSITDVDIKAMLFPEEFTNE